MLNLLKLNKKLSNYERYKIDSLNIIFITNN